MGGWAIERSCGTGSGSVLLILTWHPCKRVLPVSTWCETHGMVRNTNSGIATHRIKGWFPNLNFYPLPCGKVGRPESHTSLKLSSIALYKWLDGWPPRPNLVGRALRPVVKIQGPGFEPYWGWHERIWKFVFFKAPGQLGVLSDIHSGKSL